MSTHPPPWPGQPPPPPASGTDDGRRPGRRAIRIGVVLMVLGVAVGIALIAISVSSFVGQSRPQLVDGEVTVIGDAGDEFVLYRVRGSEAAPECSVTGPDGGSVRLDPALSAATLTLGDTSYTPLRVFEIAADGEHVVACAAPPGRLAVGPEIPLFRNIGLILSGVFGGGALFLAGLITLIVGVVRRSSTRPGPPGQSGQSRWPGQHGPPGQYGPPGQSGWPPTPA